MRQSYGYRRGVLTGLGSWEQQTKNNAYILVTHNLQRVNVMYVVFLDVDVMIEENDVICVINEKNVQAKVLFLYWLSCELRQHDTMLSI